MTFTAIRKAIETTKGHIKAPFAWAGKGLSKVPAVGFGLWGLYTEVNTTGKEYGLGAGIAKGLAYNIPYVGIGMLAYDGIKDIGDWAYSAQRAKRKSSFTQGFSDPYSTAATMRQRSQYNINRGRASIGSEANLFR